MFEASDKYIREQKVFARAVLHNDTTFIKDVVKATGKLDLEQAINAYHNDYNARLNDALTENYTNTFLLFPNIFEAMATAYVKRYKSHSYNLNNYGDKFSEFIKESSWFQTHPEVYDLANLENCFTLLFHAKGKCGLKSEDLSKTGFGENNILELIPNLYLFNSNFPIYKWWQNSSKDDESKGTPFFIYKTDKDINVYHLTRYQYQILFQLILGETITVAINTAKSNLTEEKKRNEVSALFAYLSSQRLISGFHT